MWKQLGVSEAREEGPDRATWGHPTAPPSASACRWQVESFSDGLCPMTCERGPPFCVPLLAMCIDLDCPLVTEVPILDFNLIFWIFIMFLTMLTDACLSSESNRGLNRSVGLVCLSHPASSSRPDLPRPSSLPPSLSPAIRKLLVPPLEERSKTGARPGRILTLHRREHAKQAVCFQTGWGCKEAKLEPGERMRRARSG